MLIWAGASKVGHPLTAQRAVQAYEIFPDGLANTIGLALPFLEIILGVLLVLGLFTRPVAIASTAAHGGVHHRHLRRPGRAASRSTAAASAAGARSAPTSTKYPQEIARDTVFALAGAWLWWRPRTLASLDRYLFGH